MKSIKILFVIAGVIFAGIGTIGILLPILPATPFYMLSAVCFSKGSERFQKWLTSTKLYKKHLESYSRNRSMTAKAKTIILITATLLLCFPMMVVDIFAMKFIIAVFY